VKNPFEFGRELGIDELVDREREVDSVLEAIRDGRRLFLIGPRRYGKTSILKAAEDRLLASDAVVLRFDAESYPSLDLLVAAIIAESARQLKTGIERAGEQVRGFFARLRPQLDFSLNDGTWTAKLGVDPADHADQIRLLVEALDGLESLAHAQPGSRPVGMVIDEFQKVVELGGVSAEAQIRAAVQRHKRTGYVFAGSKTKIMTAMTTDASRPFYRLGAVCFIGTVPREDFQAFLNRKFAESGFKVPEPRAIEDILDLAEEVPYNVQMLASSCWDSLRDRPARKMPELTPEVVKQSVNRLVRQHDPFYTQLWTSLTSIQQKTLLAVVAEGGINLQSMKVARATGTGPSTVRKSLDALVAKSVLREEERDGRVRMRFEDPFFAQWTRLFTGGPHRA
jgi:uncharacterized protein